MIKDFAIFDERKEENNTPEQIGFRWHKTNVYGGKGVFKDKSWRKSSEKILQYFDKEDKTWKDIPFEITSVDLD